MYLFELYTQKTSHRYYPVTKQNLDENYVYLKKFENVLFRSGLLNI